MGTLLDIVGHKFGHLTVLKRSGEDRFGHITWECICECGVVKIFVSSNLTRGLSSSCGCFRLKSLSSRSNGLRCKFPSEYRSWSSLKARCLNSKNTKYFRYGGRGIKVCDRWLNSFENFFEDMGERPSPNHTIDREKNDGNYEKENCRWATPSQQTRNKSNNRWITYNGTTMILTDWALRLKISDNLLRFKLKKTSFEGIYRKYNQ